MSFELIAVALLFGSALIVAIAYLVRITRKGHAHFTRVDHQGGSALLGKALMEMGYWCFQPLARLLIYCHFSANHITLLSLILGLLAGACLAFGHFGTGALIAALSFIMDSLDGIVARQTGRASDVGEILDTVVDRYVEFFFFGGLAIYYREVPALLILTLLALIGAFMVSYSTAKAEAFKVQSSRGNIMRRPERALYLTLGAALSPITIPIFEVERTYSIAVGHPMVIVLALIAVMANFSALERLFEVAQEVKVREKEIRENPCESRASRRVR